MLKMKLMAIVFGILAVLVLSGCTAESRPLSKMDYFAKCLSEKGVKMWGAYWCPHCDNQKLLFGKSFEYINYIECSLPNKAGQAKICIDAGIKAYPVWEFGDGTRIEGELALQELSERAGCELK